ncbi:hypothetical protein K469DRAFT_204308 [Zopfia rhizophila CBS 207.26]|uniref:Uncharacterized protein n=1 Tax=Zopfia rhizophila CBS 207.26 TaxID=1314779 RepID=A0A6A6DWL9_9PEZI|nr:hypothetical protein K469DRAFT_204308 [Zopfia rhizophila CBS 207.26]
MEHGKHVTVRIWPLRRRRLTSLSGTKAALPMGRLSAMLSPLIGSAQELHVSFHPKVSLPLTDAAPFVWSCGTGFMMQELSRHSNASTVRRPVEFQAEIS